jgi:hypothetical protein
VSQPLNLGAAIADQLFDGALCRDFVFGSSARPRTNQRARTQSADGIRRRARVWDSIVGVLKFTVSYAREAQSSNDTIAASSLKDLDPTGQRSVSTDLDLYHKCSEECYNVADHDPAVNCAVSGAIEKDQHLWHQSGSFDFFRHSIILIVIFQSRTNCPGVAAF